MTRQDPLEKLFISESQAVDRQELADFLSPYVSIDRDTQLFDFSSKFMNLQNTEKIIIILLAAKARSIFLKIEEKITPSEIIKMEIMPEGSVKGTLKALLEKSKNIKSDGGKYYLPNYKLPQTIAQFKKIDSN